MVPREDLGVWQQAVWLLSGFDRMRAWVPTPLHTGGVFGLGLTSLDCQGLGFICQLSGTSAEESDPTQPLRSTDPPEVEIKGICPSILPLSFVSLFFSSFPAST